MATKISEIIDQVRLVLQDVNKIRWQDSELFLWVGSAYREIIAVNPSLGAKVTTHTLSAGTIQALPADGISLIDIIRNMSTTTKKPVQSIERVVLDNQYPDWHSAPADSDGIKGYVYDPAFPARFWVWPQATATTTVELVYAAVPAKPTSLANDLAINDAYSGLVIDYLLYRAYSKDSGNGDANLAGNYRQAFYDSLNVNSSHKGTSQLRNPNTNGIQ